MYYHFPPRLFQYADLFISAAVGEVSPHVGRLLREVFSGGPASSLKVTEYQIKTMMGRVFLRNSNSTHPVSMEGKAEFVSVLQELMIVRDIKIFSHRVCVRTMPSSHT